MRHLSALIIVIVLFQPRNGKAETIFFTLDKSDHPNPSELIIFSSNSGETGVQTVGPVPALPAADSRSAVMDFSTDGRLFVVAHDATTTEWTVHEIDPQTGSSLAAYNTGLNALEGIAVATDGMIYASKEGGPSDQFWEIDFDQQDKTLLVSGSWEIDDIDFDADGNLIGSDMASGSLFHIPLDGTPPQLVATLDEPFPSLYPMTFSAQDDVFYFLSSELGHDGGRELWQLPWLGGLPTGEPEYVKQVGLGSYVGLAAIPEPTTIFLFSTAITALGRGRQYRRKWRARNDLGRRLKRRHS